VSDREKPKRRLAKDLMRRQKKEDSARRYGSRIRDCLITLLIWGYFTLGYLFFFSPFYVGAYLFSKNRERAFQRLNHKFFQGFFLWVRVLIPGHKWDIPETIRSIRSSIVISNHVSYLDPLLLISLFEQQKTIVKSTFFNVPIFSWVLKHTGYLPSTSEGKLSDLMIRQFETMGDFLASGGNLFVFPEGTRSRDGAVGPLHKGVFKIAKRYRPAMKILYIYNTDNMFQPGRFLFNTGGNNTITVEQIGCIEPDYEEGTFSAFELMSQVQSMLEAHRAGRNLLLE
jgi:1-acyl-sn-glycerol-3-phosphate acyltransferase